MTTRDTFLARALRRIGGMFGWSLAPDEIGQYRQIDRGGWRGRFPLRRSDLIAVAPALRAEGVTGATIHACCLLGFVALKSGVATADEVLGDYGLVHEAAHAMHIGEPDHTAETVAALADNLVQRIMALSDEQLQERFDDVVDQEAEQRRWQEQVRNA